MEDDAGSQESIGFGYAGMQLTKALAADADAGGAEARQAAQGRVRRWFQVIGNMLTGRADYGRRQPFAEVPVWVTPEVATGGFATGNWAAGGPVLPHERALLKDLPVAVKEDEARLAINNYFLTDAGTEKLWEMLESGRYGVSAPEEAALPAVCWLLRNGRNEAARTLVQTIAPWMDRLRFYPAPLPRPQADDDGRVQVDDAEKVIATLEKIAPNHRILQQREAVEVWNPFMDRMAALALELLPDNIRHAAAPGWRRKAAELLDEYDVLRVKHSLNAGPDNRKKHFAQLRMLIERLLASAADFDAASTARLKTIIRSHVTRHGPPASAQCREQRLRQRQDVLSPLHSDIGKVLADRLRSSMPAGGVEDCAIVDNPVSAHEAIAAVPAATPIPPSLRAKALRCLRAEPEELIELGVLASGEMVADVLPQVTSNTLALDIEEARLRTLMAATYRAFRRRRSLLLLHLQSQVGFMELPWVRAVGGFGEKVSGSAASKMLARAAGMTFRAFPQSIVPNKLVRELRALAGGAGLFMPLVDELAADIFMGQFKDNFAAAAKDAAELLADSVYTAYYGIDRQAVMDLPFYGKDKPNAAFIALCEGRAEQQYKPWQPAISGQILEQQQILTTHNLATLTLRLGLNERERGLPWFDMAMRTFKWVVRRQQRRTNGDWHAFLIMCKQTAYAWRQMLFFLAMAGEDTDRFASAAQDIIAKQGYEFIEWFYPLFEGVELALKGTAPPKMPEGRGKPFMFLGWSSHRFWKPLY